MPATRATMGDSSVAVTSIGFSCGFDEIAGKRASRRGCTTRYNAQTRRPVLGDKGG
jgi:hypothetical protein